MSFNQQKLILTIAALLPSEEVAIKISNSHDTYSDEGDRLWSQLCSAIASIPSDNEAGPRALSLLLDLGRMYGTKDAQLRDELLHLREKFAKQRQIKCDVAPEDMTDEQILDLVGAMFDSNAIGVIGRINSNGADWYECPACNGEKRVKGNIMGGTTSLDSGEHEHNCNLVRLQRAVNARSDRPHRSERYQG